MVRAKEDGEERCDVLNGKKLGEVGPGTDRETRIVLPCLEG